MICGAFCADANNGWTSLFPGKYIPGTECGSCCRTRLLVPKPVELEAQLRVTKPWKCRLSLHDWEVWGRPGGVSDRFDRLNPYLALVSGKDHAGNPSGSVEVLG